MIQSRATFLSRRATNEDASTMLQPFVNGGSLDESVVESHDIEASPLDCNNNTNDKATVHELFAQKGLVRVNLSEYLKNLQSCKDDSEKQDKIRSAAQDFLWSDEGQSLLRARFAEPSQRWHIRPTHVTHRTVPPDGMSLVHIDYPRSASLSQLISEWWSKWEPLLSDLGKTPEHLQDRFELVAVVTLWVFLPSAQDVVELEDHPLVVADASTLSHENDTTIYQVVGSKTVKHSVGVFYSPTIKWYHASKMTWGNAWLFDTRTNPHVSVDLAKNPDFRRQSCEVRCLVLQKKGDYPP
mmetsp:Transcript_26118/g.63694  ORF Transcript_26118/g.63694 Transcript_26118/m.63694 type:complete len:297 (+) Transcript_26118:88-978(+)